MSLPSRRYDLLAELRLEAVDTTQDSEGVRGPSPDVAAQMTAATRQVAYERGLQAGAAARDTGRSGRLGPERGLTAAASVFETFGYEPLRVGPRHACCTTARSAGWPTAPGTRCAELTMRSAAA
jgi:hypothetical protein